VTTEDFDMRPLFTAFLLAALACGGGGGSSSGSLDPAFAGTWSGTVTLSVTGSPSTSSASQLVVAVSGQSATISEVCPDGKGTGSVTAQGSGDSATWNGNVSCLAIPITGVCASVIITYTSATAMLSNGTLNVLATGKAAGCGASSPVQVSFSGTKA